MKTGYTYAQNRVSLADGRSYLPVVNALTLSSAEERREIQQLIASLQTDLRAEPQLRKIILSLEKRRTCGLLSSVIVSGRLLNSELWEEETACWRGGSLSIEFDDRDVKPSPCGSK